MKTKLDDELRDLWSRRQHLDEAGWIRLYEIVTTTLAGYRPQELAGLPGEVEVYIVDFFEDKVYRTDLSSSCDHTGALRCFFRNYLIDQLRNLKRHEKYVSTDETNEGEDEEASPAIERLADAATPTDVDEVFAVLREAGIDAEKIAAAATRWLETSEDWVRLYLAFTDCPDAESALPRSHLARRYDIRSHAYKAAQLGVTWTHDTYTGYEQTLLGQWIVSLDIEIVPGNAPLIRAVLKILCFAALTWAEQQEMTP